MGKIKWYYLDSGLDDVDNEDEFDQEGDADPFSDKVINKINNKLKNSYLAHCDPTESVDMGGLVKVAKMAHSGKDIIFVETGGDIGKILCTTASIVEIRTLIKPLIKKYKVTLR